MKLKRRSEDFANMMHRFYTENSPEVFNIINATLQVTDACNLRCSYCYQINKHDNFMTFDVGRRFIDMLLTGSLRFNEYHSGVLDGIVFDLIGGEPFLAIDKSI